MFQITIAKYNHSTKKAGLDKMDALTEETIMEMGEPIKKRLIIVSPSGTGPRIPFSKEYPSTELLGKRSPTRYFQSTTWKSTRMSCFLAFDPIWHLGKRRKM